MIFIFKAIVSNKKYKPIDEKEFKKLIERTMKAIKQKNADDLRRLISFYVSRIEIGKDDISVILSFSNIVLLVGGAEGSRTPVRKPIPKTFSERSHSFEIPLQNRRMTGYFAR